MSEAGLIEFKTTAIYEYLLPMALLGCPQLTMTRTLSAMPNWLKKWFSSDYLKVRTKVVKWIYLAVSMLFRPVLRFTDFNGHIACGHERGHGRSISRGNKRSGGGHSAQCRGSWLPSVLHVPVALWGSNRRSEAKAAKIICQLHPPPRLTCVCSRTVGR